MGCWGCGWGDCCGLPNKAATFALALNVSFAGELPMVLGWLDAMVTASVMASTTGVSNDSFWSSLAQWSTTTTEVFKVLTGGEAKIEGKNMTLEFFT